MEEESKSNHSYEEDVDENVKEEELSVHSQNSEKLEGTVKKAENNDVHDKTVTFEQLGV